MERFTPERVYEHDRKTYVFRDRYVDDRFRHCEYKVEDRAGAVAWKPCREGAEFAEVEPYQVLVD